MWTPCSIFSTRKRCLIGSLICGYQKLSSLPKKWIFGPKTDKSGPKLAFLVNYWPSWPIWPNAQPRNDANEVPRCFSVMLVPKLLLPPIRNGIFGPKMAYLGPNVLYRSFSANGLSGPFDATPHQKNNAKDLIFWYVGTRTFAPSQNNKDVGPKTAIFATKDTDLLYMKYIIYDIYYLTNYKWQSLWMGKL